MKNAVSIHEICDKFPRLTDYFGVMVNNIMLYLHLYIGKDILIILRKCIYIFAV